MNPIFKEYITFLRNTSGEELPDLKEGYFWLDNQIVKAFDKQGNIHKLYRLKVEDNLSISIRIPKRYSNIKNIEIESWQETINRNREHINEITIESKNLIKKCLSKYEGYTPIILTSGGKDSSVTMDLVRQVNLGIKAIFNNTTLDCIDTYKHIKTIDNIQYINPKEGFYQWRKRINFIPTRFSRACCTIFKEGAMMDVLDKNDKYIFFLGMRNEESSARSGYEDYWKNEKWGDNWFGCLPIRKWSELDIWMYLLMNDVSFNPKYKKGYARAGCAIACPFANKSTWVLDEYWYPMMRERWENILKEDFINNRKWIIMNCTIDEYLTQAWNGGTFRDEPTEEVVQEFAEYSNLDTKVATQYFNKYCDNGCKSQSGKLKRIKTKDVIAMNLKYHGRNVSKFYCKKCLMKMYDMNEEEWNKQIEDFKQSGCDLF